MIRSLNYFSVFFFQVVELVTKALVYDKRRGSFSVGSHIRQNDLFFHSFALQPAIYMFLSTVMSFWTFYQVNIQMNQELQPEPLPRARGHGPAGAHQILWQSAGHFQEVSEKRPCHISAVPVFGPAADSLLYGVGAEEPQQLLSTGPLHSLQGRDCSPRGPKQAHGQQRRVLSAAPVRYKRDLLVKLCYIPNVFDFWWGTGTVRYGTEPIFASLLLHSSVNT